MLGSSSPFPWWLWLLAGLWGASLVLRRRLEMSSDGRRGVDLLIAVYTALLSYSTLQSATSALSPSAIRWGEHLVFWCGGGLALGGGLLTFSAGSGPWAKWGHAGGMAGLALLAARWQAYELASLCLLVGGTGTILGGPEEDTVPIHDRVRSRDAWVIAFATTLGCVLWLGLVQHAFRLEAHRPGPSRWYTAIPSIESAARARRAGAETSTTPALTWSGLALGGALVWSTWRHRQFTNPDPQEAASVPESTLSVSAAEHV